MNHLLPELFRLVTIPFFVIA